MLRLSAPFASVYLSFFFPIVSIFLKTTRYFLNATQLEDPPEEYVFVKTKIKEILNESELKNHLDIPDQRLLTSFLTFRDKLCREIMIPRMDIFSLPASTSIQEAAKHLASEGYSRIPIYQDSLDKIIGVVLYKDVLDLYTQSNQRTNVIDLQNPIKSIVKPVIYSPENKKISRLLQEFRIKQSHLAIIVDEYGATEGIVTIEDILEELVGEIEDEYDDTEEKLYETLPNGGWVVDAKMTILDIAQKLGIELPQDPDYDTIGGYLFHRAGTIPTKGWKLQHDDFEIEVIESNDRSIDKVQIFPFRKKRGKTKAKDTLQKKPS
jgi:CBS domain containing-hemolysin-like protein